MVLPDKHTCHPHWHVAWFCLLLLVVFYFVVVSQIIPTVLQSAVPFTCLSELCKNFWTTFRVKPGFYHLNAERDNKVLPIPKQLSTSWSFVTAVLRSSWFSTSIPVHENQPQLQPNAARAFTTSSTHFKNFHPKGILQCN